MRFFDRLEQASNRNQSLLCIGLDPDMKRLPEWVLDDPDPIFAFNRHIIDLTCDLVCAYKPNIAFYEALGERGMQALRATIAYIHQCNVPVILDCKRSDIGSSAEKYAQAVFEDLNADAITVVPYMGWDSIEPFLRYGERGVFVLTLSSNPGAQDFQSLDGDGRTLFEHVATQAVGWNERQNVGLVVGATQPNEVCSVRAIAHDEWFLMPGVGSQGGDLEAALTNGLRSDGSGVVVNASRSIIYADDPREATMAMREEIEQARALRRSGAEGCTPPQRTLADDPNLVDLATGLFDIGAVQFGEFTLQSGVQSPFYLDLRLLVSNPTLLMQAARALSTILDNIHFDRIAAIPYAGLPLGSALSLHTKTPMIYPRREVKSYGTGRAIEGQFEAGEAVVVVDDVITTGSSKLTALQPLRDAGLRVHDVAVLIDRESGGREEMAAHGITLHSVFGIHEIMDILIQRERITPAQQAEVERFLADREETVA